MPRVPRYNESSVANAILGVPQATAPGPDAFGAGIGRGLEQMSSSITAIGLDEKKKQDQKSLYDARVKIDDLETKNAYGDDESEGYLSLRGDDAVSRREAYIEAFTKGVNELVGTAQNDDQRLAFEMMGKERIAKVDGQFRRHASTELTASMDASQEALEKSTLRNIGNYYNDDIRFGQELAVLRQTILEDSTNKGQPTEMKKFRLDTMTSKAYSERIDRMMQADPIVAKQFLDDNKDLMTSDDVAKYEKAVKPLVSAQLGIDAAKEIHDKNPDAPVDVQMKQLREKFKSNPDALKHGESELKAIVKERKDAKVAEIEQAGNDVYGQIAQVQLSGRIPKKSDVSPESWSRLAKVAPEKINQITDEMRRETEHQTDRARANQDRADANINTERLTTWSMLKLNPELLTKTNLDPLLVGGKLAKNQYQDLVTDQLALKGDKSGLKAETVLSNKQAVDGVLLAAGIKEGKKPEQYMKFYEALNGKMKQFKAETGASPKQDDVIRMSRGLLSEVSQDGFLWDSSKRVFDVDTAKVVVPKKDREAIKQALVKNGRPVTEETIRSLYLEKTVRGGGGK